MEKCHRKVVTRWLPTSSLRELPRMYQELNAPPGVTDVVLITDAVCRVPADVKNRLTDWKAAARVRAVALVVGSPPGDLAAVCDEAHTVPALDPDAGPVGRVLSL